jgi:hypothetical protein
MYLWLLPSDESLRSNSRIRSMLQKAKANKPGAQMRKATHSTSKRNRRRLAALATLIGASLSVAAHADPQQPSPQPNVQSPTMVEYFPNGTLHIYFPTFWITGELSPIAGCPVSSQETLKIWASMAQAALLSGKSLRVYSTYCGSRNYINDLVIQQ